MRYEIIVTSISYTFNFHNKNLKNYKITCLFYNIYMLQDLKIAKQNNQPFLLIVVFGLSQIKQTLGLISGKLR